MGSIRRMELLPHLSVSLFRRLPLLTEVPITHPLAILCCFLYVLSPIDFIPDVIPILGWLDDLGVLIHMGSQLLIDRTG